MQFTGNGNPNTLNGTESDDQFFGLSGNDTINGNGGNDLIVGGPGGDTADGGAGTDTFVLDGNYADYVITSSPADANFPADEFLVLTRNGVSERVKAVEILAFDDQAVLVVGADSLYDTVQKGVNAAEAGQTILLAPGLYDEDGRADTSNIYLPGLQVATADLTLQGVPSASGARPTIRSLYSSAQQDTIAIEPSAVGFTVDGVAFDVPPTVGGVNNGGTTKALISVRADDFTITDSTFVSGKSFYAIEVNGSSIDNYRIEGNEIGAPLWILGNAGDGGSDEIIRDNLFTGTAANGVQSGIFIQGGNVRGFAPDSPTLPGTVAGNRFADGLPVPLFVRTNKDKDPAGLLTLDYAEDFVANNLSNPGDTYAYVIDDLTGQPLLVQTAATGIDANNRDAYVASSLEVLTTYQTTGLTLGAGSPIKRDTITDNDTIVVQTNGTSNVTLYDENLTIRADEGSDDLNLTLAGGSFTGATAGFTKAVEDVTLADYATGQGADVDVTGNALDNAIIGNSGDNRLSGAGGNDTLTGGGGDDVLDGGAGRDTVVFSGNQSDYDIDLVAGTVTGADGDDTVSNVEKLDFADDDVFIVRNGDSLQAAIDAASAGDTIIVYPGTYVESGIAGPERGGASNPFGLYINTADLTIQGVKADGSLITTAAEARQFGATIISGAQTNFGANHFIDVGGTGVTLAGLHFKAGAQTDNKLLEIWADNTTVENSFLDVNRPDGSYSYAIAAFYNEAEAEIRSYSFSDNILNEGVGVFNGTGNPGEAANQVISGNVFLDTFDPVTGEGRYDTFTLQGDVSGTGFNIAPIGYPTITGNTILGNATPFILRIATDQPENFPSLDYIEQVLDDNTTASTSYAYVLTPEGELRLTPRDDDGPGGAPATNNYYVTNTIDTLNLALDDEPDVVFGGRRVTQQAGDTIVVQSGTAVVNSQIMVDDLTIRATADSANLNLTLATALADGTPTTVNDITLDDYAPGQGADVDVTGNGLANVITGNSGDNALNGAGGNDRLDGGTGDDELTGGAGDDTFLVDDDLGDEVVEAAGAGGGTDTILTTDETYGLLDANVENLTYTEDADFIVVGNTANNTITSGNGNDRLNGAAGIDVLIGGAGNDIYTVGQAGDSVTESGAESSPATALGGIDQVQSGTLSLDLTLPNFNNVENARLLGQQNLDLKGDTGANVLIGNAGDNAIAGGLGRDQLTGGDGLDRFDFNATTESPQGSGRDLIIDFDLGEDLIDLFNIDARASTAVNNSFAFIDSAAFTAEGQVRVQFLGLNTTNTTADDATLVQANTAGSGGAEFEVLLRGIHALTDADFVL